MDTACGHFSRTPNETSAPASTSKRSFCRSPMTSTTSTPASPTTPSKSLSASQECSKKTTCLDALLLSTV
eukprot:2696615-Pyramimonas_sp.AAC.1